MFFAHFLFVCEVVDIFPEILATFKSSLITPRDKANDKAASLNEAWHEATSPTDLQRHWTRDQRPRAGEALRLQHSIYSRYVWSKAGRREDSWKWEVVGASRPSGATTQSFRRDLARGEHCFVQFEGIDYFSAGYIASAGYWAGSDIKSIFRKWRAFYGYSCKL